ncbi:MAG TPA: tetratricopeptide repeat protein, partial [Ignavibacteriaceae bacterium]|nr:tetratricopeptide repeat protein [Ignavibacteriaceae bacterium]
MSYKKIKFIVPIILLFALNLSAQDIASGIKLIKNEKYSEAKKYFAPLTNTKSAPEAYFYLGQIYFSEEKFDSARINYSKGIEKDKDFAPNYAGLVKVYNVEKNTSLVNKNEEEALDLGEDNPDTYIALSEAYSNPKVKNYDKAIELLKSGIKVNSKYTPSYIALGKVYLLKTNGTDAAKNFQTAIDLDGTNAEALTLKAKIYVLVNNYKEATTLLEEAITKDPAYAPAYYELAELNSTLRDYAKAADYFGKYMEASEVTLEKRRRFASILYLNKEYSKSINILEDVIKTEPDNPVATRMLAYSYLKLEDTEKSMSFFKKLFDMPSIEYLPSDYENYADLLSETGNDSLAREYM